MSTQGKSQSTMIKCVVLGSSGVGKSSIMYRYVTNSYDENVQATLGAAFLDKQITYKGHVYKFQIWDTAGQEKYAPLAQMYYKDANVALLVYDKSSKESLDSLKMWKTQLEEKGPRNVMKVILGNKYDLPNDESSVATSEGETFARECNAMFFKTSAKEGTGVVEAFEAICEKLYNSDGMSPTKESKGTKLGGKQGGNTGKKCC